MLNEANDDGDNIVTIQSYKRTLNYIVFYNTLQHIALGQQIENWKIKMRMIVKGLAMGMS